MAQAVKKTPPDTLPADFDGFDKSAPDTLPANFFESAKPIPATGTITAGKTPSWLDNAEEDVTNGGGRTILGRVMGKMQGSDTGYSGVRGGVSEAASDMMSSPLRGLLHAGQSAQSIPDHPVKGALGTIGGLLEAGTIPGMVMAGPTGQAASDAIPSAKYAGKVLGSVLEDAKDVPVNLSRTMKPLERTQQLADAGASPSGVADKLFKRANTINPITYGEGRDFYTNVTNQSVADKLAQNGPMKGAMGDLREAFKKDLGDAAGVVGRGEDYAKAMKEYAQAHTMKDVLTKALKYGAYTAGAGGALTEGAKLLHIFGK